MLIAESGPHRYVQALAFEDGALIAEVVSNHWIEGNFRWTSQQEGLLQDLGWALLRGSRFLSHSLCEL